MIKKSEITNSIVSNPIESAQVKSALLLASLFSGKSVKLKEKYFTRNHTEKMIEALGGNISYSFEEKEITFDGKLHSFFEQYFVADDPSSISFFVPLILFGNSFESVLFKNVLLNPYRIGFFEVLQKMGASIQLINIKKYNMEDIGDVLISKNDKNLQNIDISADFIGSLIDEIPILVYVAAKSEGKFKISGIKNLKNKESDRIKNIIDNFQNIGIKVFYDDEMDILEVNGMQDVSSGVVFPKNDHRFIMLFEIISLIENKNIVINSDKNYVNISFPKFYDILEEITK